MILPRLMIVILAAALSPIACRADVKVETCRFHEADLLLKLTDDVSRFSLQVARRAAEPNALLVLDFGHQDPRGVRATRVDLSTGEKIADLIPAAENEAWPPVGYILFQSGERPREQHPLIATGKLRFEYLGRKGSLPYLHLNLDGKWSVDHDEIFTGTRRMMYGNRLLLEQDFVNYGALGHLFEYVQIEPNGDRIVSLCQDSKGTWIGVFAQKKLEAKHQSLKPK